MKDILYMKILIKVMMYFLAYIFLSECCHADDEKQIKKIEINSAKVKIVSEVYPPYQFIDKNGELHGWSADKVKSIFRHADVTYNINVYPWTRAYQLALIQPNTFIYSLLRTEIRESLFQWVLPLCPIEFSFYRLKKRTDIEVNSINDAKNYLIAAQKGQASAEYLLDLGFEPGKNLTVSYNNDNFIQLLAHERVDLIVLSSGYVQSKKLTDSLYINEIEAIFPIDYLGNSLYLASSLNTSSALIEKIRNAYSEISDQFAPTCHD